MEETCDVTVAKKRKNINEEISLLTNNILEIHSDLEVIEIPQTSSADQEMGPASQLGTLSYNCIRNIIREKRKWWYTSFGKRHILQPVRGLEFTVMSYNVLSQTLLENHPYLYRNCELEHLSWDYRCQNLFREIDKHSADIMCFQEVQENHYKEAFFPHLFERGYLGLYKKKTGNTCDGCAIFFKKSMFMLQAKNEVEFSKPGIKVLDRNNIGLIAVLKPKNRHFQHLKLVCATTHLLFNSRRGDVKLAQLRTLLASIEEMARKENPCNENVPEYHPIILCGDMNSHPYYPLYDFIVRGYIRYMDSYSGDVSGQDEGYSRGQVMTEDALTLTSLGINRNTCFEPLNASNNTDSPNLVSENSNLLNNAVEVKSDSDTNESTKDEQNYRGCFFHPLNFKSVYKHTDKNGENEVTTRHSRCMATVDYIFYNTIRDGVAWKNSYKEKSGQLKHIGCYGLLHDSDFSNMELPNAYLASDHFSLMSSFLLTRK